MRHLLILSTIALCLPFAAGCNEDSKPTGFRERQNAAIADPMGYSPWNEGRPSVSGGGTTEFNRKAFKRDVDSVLNP